MSNEKLTFKEFLRLPREVQNIRYKELSSHDRFLARMNDWGENSTDPNSDEDWEPSREEINDILSVFNDDSKK